MKPTAIGGNGVVGRVTTGAGIDTTTSNENGCVFLLRFLAAKRDASEIAQGFFSLTTKPQTTAPPTRIAATTVKTVLSPCTEARASTDAVGVLPTR